MDAEIHGLHLEAGRKAGIERTCGKRIKYADETTAGKAAASLNRSPKKRHDVEPYPCAFCNQWHIGGIMPVEILRKFAAGEA
jgi:hypothetical protein